MGTAPAAQRSATIVFSHANGFPAGTYRQHFALWRQAGFDVQAVEQFGHDPRYPVTPNWPHLRDELLAHIDRIAQGPVWLVGHSLGGFLSLMAAAHRPGLACGVVMLDSPILPPVLSRAVQFAQATGVGQRFSPGAVSKRRREHWPDAEAAYQHFARKPAFARWAPGVLRDYIDAGTAPVSDGLRLKFRREVETAIYDALANHIGRLLKREPLSCPLAFVAGTESTEVRQVGLKVTTRVAAGRVSWLPGSHLFPFERPAETAAEVLRWLDVLAALPAHAGPGLPPRL